MSTPKSHRKVPFLRTSYFTWILVPAILFAAYLVFGLPHVIWSYQFTGSYGDLTARTYHECTWWGPYGRITQSATNGTCALIRFFHKGEVTP